MASPDARAPDEAIDPSSDSEYYPRAAIRRRPCSCGGIVTASAEIWLEAILINLRDAQEFERSITAFAANDGLIVPSGALPYCSPEPDCCASDEAQAADGVLQPWLCRGRRTGNKNTH